MKIANAVLGIHASLIFYDDHTLLTSTCIHHVPSPTPHPHPSSPPHLYNTLHEILLSNGVTTANDLLENVGQDLLLVEGGVHSLQLREAHQIGPHQDPELQTFFLPSLTLPCVPLVLHAHPQLVHLIEVVKDECNGVFY